MRGGKVKKERERESGSQAVGDTKTLSCTFHLANQTAQIRPPELGLASSVRNRILWEENKVKKFPNVTRSVIANIFLCSENAEKVK